MISSDGSRYDIELLDKKKMEWYGRRFKKLQAKLRTAKRKKGRHRLIAGSNKYTISTTTTATGMDVTMDEVSNGKNMETLEDEIQCIKGILNGANDTMYPLVRSLSTLAH